MRKWLLLIFLFAINASFGQIKKLPMSFEAHAKFGYLMVHRPVMSHLQQGHIWGVEVNYKIHTLGKKEWANRYKKPAVGFSLQYLNLGYKDVLGSSIAVFPFLELPFINKKSFGFNFKIGLGYAYLTKKFDQENNPLNLAIGTHSNAVIQLGAQIRKTFGNTSIQFGIDFTHFSNASSQVPNLGLNIPNINLGVAHQIQPSDSNYVVKRKKHKGISFHGQVSAGFKEQYPTGGKKHLTFEASAFMNSRFGFRSAIDYGFDVFYNGANRNPPFNEKHSIGETIQIGAFAQHNFIINDLRILLGIGVYIKDNLRLNGYFYNRLGLRYYLKKHIYFNLQLKTHIAKADYISFGIGYFYRAKGA